MTTCRTTSKDLQTRQIPRDRWCARLCPGARLVSGLSGLGLGLLAAADPASPPGLEIAPGVPGELLLSWPSEAQRPYQVETSVDLETWTDEGDTMVGTGEVIETTVPAQGVCGFFRLREGAVRPGFDALAMSRGDDHSYSAGGFSAVRVDIGFPVNFFGTSYNSCYINNNGNITFDAPLFSYTPEALIKSRAVMIAPFWADVDTRNGASDVTRFSLAPGTVGDRPAFGVSWRDVGYFSYRVDKTNSFQLVLVNRCDRAQGDFDIEFNYNRVRWETGDASGGILGFGGSPARVGWTNGNGLFMEFKGSGESMALLDHKPGGLPNFTSGLIYQNWNSGVPGRILIRVVNGQPQTEPGLDFTVNAGPDIMLPNNAGRNFGLSATVTPADTTGLTYFWVLETGPYDEVTFTNVTTATPTVLIPEPGNYVFRVSAVKQGTFIASSSDTVMVTHPGVFDVYAGGTYECSGSSPRVFRLDNAYARFNNQNLGKLHWKQTTGPVGSVPNPGVINPDVVLPVPGVYQFTLTATSDHLPGFEKSSTATVIFSASP